MEKKMRKLYVIALVIVCLVLTAVWSQHRVQIPQFSLMAPASPVALGDVLPVTIEASDLKQPIQGFQLDLTYDELGIVPQSVQPLQVGLTCPPLFVVGDGVARVSCVSSTPFVPSGALVEVALTAVSLQPATLNLDNIRLLSDTTLVVDAGQALTVKSKINEPAALSQETHGLAWHNQPQAETVTTHFAAQGQLTEGQVVDVTVETTQAGYVATWVDWDNDGRYHPTAERPLAQAVTAGTNNLILIVPRSLDSHNLQTRTRFYLEQPSLLQPTGGVTGGLVQDTVWILQTSIWPDVNWDFLWWLLLPLILGLGIHFRPRNNQRYTRYQRLNRAFAILMTLVMLSESSIYALVPESQLRRILNHTPSTDTPINDRTPAIQEEPTRAGCDLFDLDCNGEVNGHDQNLLFNQLNCGADATCYAPYLDLNNDGEIDLQDWQVWLGAVGFLTDLQSTDRSTLELPLSDQEARSNVLQQQSTPTPTMTVGERSSMPTSIIWETFDDVADGTTTHTSSMGYWHAVGGTSVITPIHGVVSNEGGDGSKAYQFSQTAFPEDPYNRFLYWTGTVYLGAVYGQRVSISLDLKSVGPLNGMGDLSQQDFFYATYSRYGSEIPFAQVAGGLSQENTYQTFSTGEFVANSTARINIYVRVDDSSKSYYVDNLSVNVNDGPPAPTATPVPTIPIWQETFEDLAENSQVDAGNTAWTTVGSNQYPPSHGVAVGEGNGGDGGGKAYRISQTTPPDATGAQFLIWESEEIDISGKLVAVALDVRSKGALTETGGISVEDAFYASYQVDIFDDLLTLKPAVHFQGGLSEDDVYQTFTTGSFTGHTVKIIVSINVAGLAQHYYMDNIRVIEVDEAPHPTPTVVPPTTIPTSTPTPMPPTATPLPPTATATPPPTTTPVATPASLTNVALNKPVMVDSTYNGSTVGSNAVDGNRVDVNSRWLSNDANNSEHWLEVDLEQPHAISEVRFWTGYDGYNTPLNNYKIQIWNGGLWHDLVVRANNNTAVVVESFSPINTNKVRLLTEPPQGLVRVYELEIYGVPVDMGTMTPMPTPTPYTTHANVYATAYPCGYASRLDKCGS